MELHSPHQEPHPLEQETVIARSPDRSLFVAYISVNLAFVLFVAVLLISTLIGDVTMIRDFGFPSFDLGESLKGYVSLVWAGCFFGSFAWQMLSKQILAKGPPLLIDRLGMHLGTLPMVLDRVSLSWEQIGTISSRYVFTDRYLCICPKQPGAFFASLGFWRQIPARLNYLVLGAPVVVPQSTMNCTAQQVLNLLRERYASTLDDHAIVLKF